MTVNHEGTVKEEDLVDLLLERNAPTNTEGEEETNTTDTEEEEALEEDNLDETEDEVEDTEDEDEGEEPEDDLEEETEDEDEDEELELITVKVDGEDKEVTLDELRNGYMMDADYRRKTMVLAEQKKEAERLQESLSQTKDVRQQNLQELETLETVIGGMIPTDQQLAQVLSEQGSEAYLGAKHEAERLTKIVQGARARHSDISNELTTEQKQKLGELKTDGLKALSEKMPALAKKENQVRLNEYIQAEYGYTDEQLDVTYDPNLFIMAEKARKYDAMKSKVKTKTKGKIPKVLKKKSAPKDKLVTREKKLQVAKKRAADSGGNIDAYAEMLLQRKSN